MEGEGREVYMEFMKNYVVAIGVYDINECGEFMLEEMRLSVLLYETCGCH